MSSINGYKVPSGVDGFDMTPMIDVVFLLIVFFMTVASMITADKVDLNLAVAEESAIPRDIKNRYTFSILADGSLYAGPTEVTENRLRELISNVGGQGKQSKIVLRVDSNTEHQHVNRILAICTEYGINDIIFATYETDL